MTAARPAPLVRGWCPGALRPMATGDGLLIRLHPPGGRLSIADMRLIARLSRATGNGLVDLTGRGNLQIRGVSAESHPVLVEGLVTAGLVASDESDGPYRLTIVSPLAGRDPAELFDAAALAAAIEALRPGLAGLPPKIAVLVDAGGALPLDGEVAELRLRAASPDRVLVGLAGGAWFGPVRLDVVPALVEGLLRPAVEGHRASPAMVRRLSDIPRGVLEGVLARFGGLPAAAPARRPAAARAGLVRDRAGASALLIGAPFGRSDAGGLEALAGLAETAGADGFGLAPWRGFAMTGLVQAAPVLAGIAAAGFIIRPDDPRLVVRACPGAPACSRGEAPAQADAARFAAAAAARIADGLTLHVSGCAKGCAGTGIADLTLVGHEGAYQIVLGGTAGGRPVARLDAAGLVSLLARPGGIDALVPGVSSS